MIVGAFLAESASAVDNKLNVSGGVLFRYTLDADRLARFLLVVLTQTETGNPDRRGHLDAEDRESDLGGGGGGAGAISLPLLVSGG
ncbi:hypothetical protein [Mycobacterium pseudokansasii]|uniref:hypothetical protein n=1 Tax=Mycobacterium pseudokansasii TaxID=2341080 RepID=UPI000F03804E|nr:hypothetical protein [Mycobacterium pseudokansasii]VBA33910.1 hypothetical protein LAUMK35_05601 [Mycobacterium pseudokansasii]